MSTFAVTRERIGAIRPIANADRIEIATLAGMDFQFVVGKGVYSPGDEVLYFPVDAVLPPHLIEVLGLTGRLSGKEQNRIKTLRLRGAYSQGVVAPAKICPTEIVHPTKITQFFGVTKWDPPPNEVNDGILVPRPDGQSMYDLESADRYTDIAARLMDRLVCITEKLEGENTWVTAQPDGTYCCGMRDNTILLKPDVPNRFHKVLHEERIVEFAQHLAKKYAQRVTVYGEYIGPGCGAGNHYGLSAPRVVLFDIRVTFDWLTPATFREEVMTFLGNKAHVAPVLCLFGNRTLREWLDGRTIKEASDGRSELADVRREGIVIKPLIEDRDDCIGRLVLKQRSPAYLANTDL